MAAPIYGVLGTGSVGTVSINQEFAVTGLAGTGAVGAVTIDFKYDVTGVSGTGAVGTVSVNQAFAVTGLSATGAIGSPFCFGNKLYLLTMLSGRLYLQVLLKLEKIAS